jgi:uncharacterized protein YuzE
MKVHYDEKHDIAYIRCSQKKPDSAIGIDEGVFLDTTAENEMVGIESSMLSNVCRSRACFS